MCLLGICLARCLWHREFILYFSSFSGHPQTSRLPREGESVCRYLVTHLASCITGAAIKYTGLQAKSIQKDLPLFESLAALIEVCQQYRRCTPPVKVLPPVPVGEKLAGVVLLLRLPAPHWTANGYALYMDRWPIPVRFGVGYTVGQWRRSSRC